MSGPSAAPQQRVQFHEDEGFLVDAVGAFIGAGLSLGQPAIVVATESHRRELESLWRAHGIDVAAAQRDGQLVLSDAAATLSSFMIDGWPDPQRFHSAMGELVERASPQGTRAPVRAFGEMVDVLWAQGKTRAALRLEELWSEVARWHSLSLLCAYRVSGVASDTERSGDPPSALAVLQHRTEALEAELVRREAVEQALLQRELQLRAQVQELEAKCERAEDAVGALRRTNERKDEFLAMLGHELRNPLAAVQNTLVLAGLDPARSPHALAIARRQAGQLRRLIDDLLDVARISEGHIQLRREPVALARAVDGAVEALRGRIAERGHRLTVEAPADDVYVDADPARLEQILGNLLSNAAKYTPIGGRIEISVDVGIEEAAVRISDSGIGIEPEMKAKIFDLFVQGTRGQDRSHGGLGIGLNVAQQLTHLHGGRIEVWSEGVGLGSQFSLYLPLLDAPDATVEPPAEVGAARSVRILVVEDNADVAEALAELLDVLGHRVRTANDGGSAIAAATEEMPELMLIDIGLPEIDGYEVARQVRKLPGADRATLVALTGYGNPEDRRLSLAAGFDHHLVKPVDPEAIEAIVAMLAPPSQE